MIQSLLDLLQDEKAKIEVQIGAAAALGQLGKADETVLHALSAVSQNNKANPGLRIEAAKSLGQLGDKDMAIWVLLELVHDKELEKWEQFDAVQGLVKLGYIDEAVSDFLFTLVGDRRVDYFIRTEGAKTLGELGRADLEVIQNLYTLAHDKEMESYGLENTLEAMAKLGKRNTVAMSALLQLAFDKDEGIRYGAYQVLKRAVGNLRYKEIEKYQVIRSKRKKVIRKPKSIKSYRKS